MKKIYLHLKVVLSMLLAASIVLACNKDDAPPVKPKVITSVAYDITEISFSVAGNITMDGDVTITERGVCWGTVPNPDINGNKEVSIAASSGEFPVIVTGLKSGTLYYFRSFVTGPFGTEYGDQRNVTTQGQLSYTLPFVERFLKNQFLPTFWSMIDHDGDDENWYAYTSRFRGAISDSYSGGALTPYNFLVTPKINLQGSQITLSWNVGATHPDCEEHYKVVVSEQPFTENNCTSVGTIVFEETLTSVAVRTLVLRTISLDAYKGKDVYVAWVHYNCSNQDGLVVTDIQIESAEQSINTTTPVLGTLSADGITPVSADVSSIVSDDGGLTVIRKGFCYSATSPATIGDNVVDISIASSSASAAFTETLSLNRAESYFVRAFAVNAEGISYSNEVSITTPASVKEVIFSEDFALGVSDFGWNFIDKDGDGKGWTYHADDEDQCARSRSYESGSGALTPENYMVLPAIELSSSAVTLELNFLVAAASGGDYAESYEVLISTVPVTADNCRTRTSIKPLETLTAENRSWTFTERTVDLTAYRGQTVYIVFVHKDCTDQASLLIDNIEVASFI